MTHDDSAFEEDELREILGKRYSEVILNTLRNTESQFRKKRASIAKDTNTAKISIALHAIKINKLFVEFHNEIASIIGKDACVQIFEIDSVENFQLLDVERAAEEDTKRLKSASEYERILYPSDAIDIIGVRDYFN